MQITWDWFKGGAILGAVFLLAVILVKPLGVSTQFVIFDGIVWNLFSEDVTKEDTAAKHGYTSENAYLAKSGGKYAKNVDNPINYGFVLIIAMFAGGFLSAALQKNKLSEEDKKAPQVFRESGKSNRYVYAFAGGILTLFVTRLAGGCTSANIT
ncbi:MAG: YeeE/YedE family protein [Kangiellaceae bacterium]|nr:YeeE/YedE family protein [Kangiellaceae bacterium]